MEKVIKYTRDDLTVEWRPDKCIHSTNCVHGLPGVFNIKAKPWINVDGADNEQIISQVNKCPSGALSINKLDMSDKEKTNGDARVEVLDKGPYLIKGSCVIVDKDGKEELKEGNIALCRCGASSNKPYCDGSHKNTDVL